MSPIVTCKNSVVYSDDDKEVNNTVEPEQKSKLRPRSNSDPGPKRNLNKKK